MIKRFEIEITRTVVVEIDSTRFTPELMAGFNEHIADVGDRLDDHAEYIAEQAIDNSFVVYRGFMEGYGCLREAGVKVSVTESHEVIFDGLSAQPGTGL